MITEGEAQVLVMRIAASNIAMRQMMGVLNPDDVTALSKVLDANAKVLKDFAAEHPATLGSIGDNII